QRSSRSSQACTLRAATKRSGRLRAPRRSSLCPFLALIFSANGLVLGFGDHPLERLELGNARAPRLKGPRDVLTKRPVKYLIEEFSGELPEHPVALHPGEVEIGFPGATVADESLLLHGLKKAEHGRIRHLPVARPELTVDLAHRGLPPRPKDLERLKL